MKKILLSAGTLILLAACNGEDTLETNVDVSPVSEVRERMEADWDSGLFEEKVFDYESTFSAADYEGQIEGNVLYDYQKGEEASTVLITAPHTVTQMTNEETRPAQIYTGALIQLLHDYTGAHVLYTIQSSADPAFYEGAPIKEEMRVLAEEEEFELVIDLHGAAESRNFHVHIATGEEEYISPLEAETLAAYLYQNDIGRVVKDETVPLDYSRTLAEFASSELSIEALQLEIHADYRNPREDLESMYVITRALSEYIFEADRLRR
ncbi:hypothetical protein [Alkalicoccus halolimnae]|uniref:Uncharacterized protein n=1 Tax=Alkalicoccus halolimnae TaxID=1667239 RepID=A0A5C7EZG1_9BACI|nr:hypothetical protein [Alkalicoccus halolimnae]TXF81434.1 hypothetical protein FTX54_15935 [Alkalicoccus halolimnae]